jgi:hypothetical protein
MKYSSHITPRLRMYEYEASSPLLIDLRGVMII